MVMDMTSRQMRDLTENWDYWPENIAWAPGARRFSSPATTRNRTGVQHRCGDMRNRHHVNEQADFSGIHPVSDTEVIALRNSMRFPKEIVSVKKNEVKNSPPSTTNFSHS